MKKIRKLNGDGVYAYTRYRVGDTVSNGVVVGTVQSAVDDSAINPYSRELVPVKIDGETQYILDQHLDRVKV